MPVGFGSFSDGLFLALCDCSVGQTPNSWLVGF